MRQPISSNISNTLVTEMMITFSQSGDLIQTLEWGLPRVLASIDAQAGSLFLHHPATKKLACAVCIGPVDIKGITIPDDQGIVGLAFRTKMSRLISNVSKDKNYYHEVDKSTGFKTKSIITVPLYFGDEVYGALQAINRMDAAGKVLTFSKRHLAIFEAVAIALGLALKNIKLTEKIVLDKLIQKDVDEAQQVQQCLFPQRDQFEFISGGVIPYRSLSGDFIDYFIHESKIAFIEGDVSGKGMPAALLMARSIALFRSFSRRGLNVEEIASKINEEIYLHGTADRFVTAVIGWYDPAEQSITFVNCGHNPVLHAGDTHAVTYGSTAPPLGVSASPDFSPHPVSFLLKENEAIYIATDGITEASINGHELGLDGLAKMAAKQSYLNAIKRAAQILSFVESKKLMTIDDATLLVITS